MAIGDIDTTSVQGLDRTKARLLPEELETGFLYDLLQRKRRHIAVILVCSGILSLLLMIPDSLLLAQDARHAWFNHTLSLCFSIYSFATATMLWRLHSPRIWQTTLALWWLLAIFTICLGNTSYPAGSISYMLFDVLIPVAICLLIPIGYLLQLGLAVLFAGLDMIILLNRQHGIAQSDLWLVIFALLTGIIVAGIACWQNHISERKNFLRQQFEQQARKEAERLLEEVHTLRGILPICSYCKQIRDDEGYWHEVERYIRKHSAADFTHGICPRCLAEHFPREYAKIYPDGHLKE